MTNSLSSLIDLIKLCEDMLTQSYGITPDMLGNRMPSFNVEILGETLKSFKVWFIDQDWATHLPKSQIKNPKVEDLSVGYKGQIQVTDWIARQKSQEYDAEQAELAKQGKLGSDKVVVEKTEMVQVSLVDANKVYRKLVAKYHPDVNGGPDNARFMSDLNELWDQVKKAVRGANQ
jgi:hypothetical protein